MPLYIMQPNKSCTEAIVRAPTNRHLHGKGERNGTQGGTKVEKSHIFSLTTHLTNAVKWLK